jgi:hypothetical protein
MVSVVAILLLAGGVSPSPVPAKPRPAPPRADLSWAEADALGAKLNALDKRQKDGRTARAETIQVTEGEVNSYVNLEANIPEGVTDVTLRLDRDRVTATATVDLDRIPGKPTAATSSWNPFSLVSGRVPVVVSGKLVSKGDGFASFEVEEVRLGSFPLPATVLSQLVASATRGRDNPQGVDLLAPFRLPYTMKRVRLQPARALLEF